MTNFIDRNSHYRRMSYFEKEELDFIKCEGGCWFGTSIFMKAVFHNMEFSMHGRVFIMERNFLSFQNPSAVKSTQKTKEIKYIFNCSPEDLIFVPKSYCSKVI